LTKASNTEKSTGVICLMVDSCKFIN
jgi:hypothetical protein